MHRITRVAAVVLVTAGILSAGLMGGCKKEPAPVLSPQQLAAGVIGKEHPINQEQATKMGCSCHLEAAKKAGGQ